jgi:hypothetical protein
LFLEKPYAVRISLWVTLAAYHFFQ